MEVILLERIEKLGQMGDVVNVKPGYARNFLLPRNKALRANADNMKRFDDQRAQLEAENLKLREEAAAVSEKMQGLTVVLIRQAGESGQLYGSVNARDIATSVSEAGFTIARTQVALNTPIKTLGLFDVRVDLHPEVSVVVRANVARTLDEAEIQAKTGAALVGQDHGALEEDTPSDEDVFEVPSQDAEEDFGEVENIEADIEKDE
ncbi:50S ribosomal protein L9 [Varunaivibrio sulfuroxidans]|uniref:Large ribosomal subunit protein bL9 n=1 Tax=Varunaivibrio sulfuroxidans TaxID=1773489 RepID=A0A4R3J4I6_9PROT|nr:50S ribosomal protein L9 [Varunaivibrio sulfuroxidans]TCS60132.1 large subunit ribosomal protein L9 [Varunaivibrio sulfuroxidans]WES32244.1 50S ribosomal protein L9 [Varunaivibrio sulfuroxidans]